MWQLLNCIWLIICKNKKKYINKLTQECRVDLSCQHYCIGRIFPLQCITSGNYKSSLL